MAASIIGSLRVALGLDTATFERGATSAEKRARQLGDTIGKNLRGGLLSANNALGLFGITLSAGAIVAAGKNALDYASSLGEVAQQLSVTTKDLQVYRYAASQVGVSQEEMDKGLSKLSLSIGQAADGAKKQATTFNDLGINVRDAGGNIRATSDILPQLADALAQIKDPATRARIEVELFGKTGQKLDTLLSGGSKAINELAAAAEKAGVVLSPDLIQRADDAADKLSAVKQVLEAKIAGVVADNAGAILQLGDALVWLIDKAGQAAKAWRVFVLEQKANNAESRLRGLPGLFISETDKRDALQEASDLRTEINGILNPKAMVRTGKGAGSLFDAQSNPLDVRGALGGVASGRQASGLNRIVGGGGGKKSGSHKAAKAEIDEVDEAAKAADISIRNMGDALRDLTADAYESDGLSSIRDAIDTRTDVKLAGWEDMRREQARLYDEGQDRVRGLADLFESEMNGAGGSFWDQWKDMGKRAVSEILSRLLTNNGGQGGGLSAILGATSKSIFGGLGSLTSLFGGGSNASIVANSATLSGTAPIAKFARGGTIGGFGGVDRNLLSINGMPTAMVGRGEMLKIEPNNDNVRGGTNHFHLEGAVLTQDLVNQMNAIGQASQLGAVGQVESRAARRAKTRL